MVLHEIPPIQTGSQFLDLIEVTPPENLDDILHEAQQIIPYLPGPEQNLLRNHILKLGKTWDSAFADKWLYHAFSVGSPDASKAISTFLSHRNPPQNTASIARRYLRLLEVEAKNYTGNKLPALGPKRSLPPATEQILTLLGTQEITQFKSVIATDCDGTTWSGDIGELLFESAVQAEQLLPEALPALKLFLGAYDIPSQNDANENAHRLLSHYQSGSLLERGIKNGKTAREVSLDFYKSNIWAFAGHSIGTIKAWTKQLFEMPGGLKSQLHPGVLELLRGGENHGLVPLAISASNLWSTELAGRYLGIPPRHCRGIRTAVRAQILTPEIEAPIPFGEGKVEAIQTICGGLPTLALGDSFEATDKEMLQKASCAGVISPGTEEAAMRLKHCAQPHWFTLEPQRAQFERISSLKADD